MNRTRIVFTTIIIATVVLILGILLVQLIGGDESTEPESPTPLPEGTILVSIASSNTKRKPKQVFGSEG